MTNITEMERHADYDHPLFEAVNAFVGASYLVNLGHTAMTPVFRVSLPKGKLFDAYLAGFPEERRQHYNCACCRAFLNKYGSLVRIEEDGTLTSLFWNSWKISKNDLALDPLFQPSFDAMRQLVETADVSMTFLTDKTELGVDELGGFKHFHSVNMNPFFHRLKKAHQATAEHEQTYAAFSRMIGTVKQEELDTALNYFKHDKDLSVRTAWVGHLDWITSFKRRRDAIPNARLRKNVTWLQVITQTYGRTRMRKSPLGNFINALTEGRSLPTAKQAFLVQTSGENYQVAKEAPKAGNKAKAEEIFAKLGIASALQRRPLRRDELRGIVWTAPVKQASSESEGIFGSVKTRDDLAEKAKPVSVIDGGPITLERFVREVLPTVDAITFPINGRQVYPFAGFTTAVHADAKPLLKYDKPDNRNPASAYLYAGGSTMAAWNLLQDNSPVKVTHITTTPDTWTIGDDGADKTLMFILDRGYDVHLSRIPLHTASLIPELHEVRATVEAYFASNKLQPLEKDEQTVVAMVMSPNESINIPVQVTTDAGATVRYLIDRGR